ALRPSGSWSLAMASSSTRSPGACGAWGADGDEALITCEVRTAPSRGKSHGRPGPARYRDLHVAGRSHSARRPFATLGIPHVVLQLLPLVLVLASRPWPRERPRLVHRARCG